MTDLPNDTPDNFEDDFPREFNCKCGSDRRCTQMFYDEQVALNKAPAMTASMRKVMVPMTQPALAVLTVTAAFFQYDICFDCGAEYCFRVEQKEVPMTAQMPGTSPGQLPPFGGMPKG